MLVALIVLLFFLVLWTVCRSPFTSARTFLLALALAAGSAMAQETEVPSEVITPEQIQLIREKAEQGDAEMQTALGEAYYLGMGVSQDDAEAIKWYRRAAEQGYVQAQYNLGLMYDRGRGVSRNYLEAIKWYNRAAEQGHAQAQFNMYAQLHGQIMIIVILALLVAILFAFRRKHPILRHLLSLTIILFWLFLLSYVWRVFDSLPVVSVIAMILITVILEFFRRYATTQAK